MKHKADSVETLIISYLNGELSEEGKTELFDRLKDPEKKQFFIQLAKLRYRFSFQKQQDQIDYYKAFLKARRQLKLRRMVKYAVGYAAAISLLVVGFYYFSQQNGITFKNETVAKTAVNKETNQVTLTLDNGETIELGQGMDTIISSHSNTSIKVDAGQSITYAQSSQSLMKHPVINSIKVPRGGSFSITLCDGTKVWLNSLSSISYPEIFACESREVTLRGEAYFEVAHNAESPFIVHTGDMSLRVLGTSFDIRSYSDENYITTTLLSGSVSQRYFNVDDEIRLTPGNQSVYTKASGDVELRPASIKDVLAWREGRIIIKNERLEDVFHHLSKWYSFDVTYKDPVLKDVRFYLNIKRYPTIGDVLQKMQKTNGLKFTIDANEQIIIYK